MDMEASVSASERGAKVSKSVVSHGRIEVDGEVLEKLEGIVDLVIQRAWDGESCSGVLTTK